ncbi:MAG: sulfate adenylyltransferase [Dehalococcoidia bacterium]|nr:sulfate adenylyltransferase [Dehalococcoidia bacterium]
MTTSTLTSQITSPHADIEETIAPHGGTLVDRFATPNQTMELRERAPELTHITLNARETADLDLIAVGAMSPLTGFMNQADYERTVHEMRLADGTLWSLPITLSAPKETAQGLKQGQDVVLVDHTGRHLAILTVDEVYEYDKQVEAQNVFGTTEEAHPGVASMYSQHDMLIGGSVTVIERENLEPELRPYREDPAQTRAAFAERHWRTIVGFQTRNPVHRAHEYIQKSALEIVDGLLLHPLVGETKPDDIPADVRMKCYEALLEGYYPEDRVHLSVLPAAMRYAGPREAVFHALVRKNYGCTHFIVGRDHAGVGNYYGTYDAQDLLRSLPPEDLGITPLYFEHSFYCKRCEGMASMKTCPCGPEHRVFLSGTQVRDMLARGEVPPMEFTRPEVAKILIEAARN